MAFVRVAGGCFRLLKVTRLLPDLTALACACVYGAVGGGGGGVCFEGGCGVAARGEGGGAMGCGGRQRGREWGWLGRPEWTGLRQMVCIRALAVGA